jgi:hypothetical protein
LVVPGCEGHGGATPARAQEGAVGVGAHIADLVPGVADPGCLRAAWVDDGLIQFVTQGVDHGVGGQVAIKSLARIATTLGWNGRLLDTVWSGPGPKVRWKPQKELADVVPSTSLVSRPAARTLDRSEISP